MFSSDGMCVYDSLWTVMPGGTLIAPPPVPWINAMWRQAVAIAPAPGADSTYYVFYWSGATAAPEPTFALNWAVVDTHRRYGRGAVVDKGHELTRTRRAQLVAVRHANNRDFWLVVHTPGTRGFQAFLLDKRGVQPAPVVSLDGQTEYPDDCALSAAPNGRRLAGGGLARSGGPDELLTCAYDFDNATGRVSNEQVLRRTPYPPLNQWPQVWWATDGRPSGVTAVAACAFSPDSRLLYAIELRASPPQFAPGERSAEVWQYDLSQPTLAGRVASRFWVSNVPTPPDTPPLPRDAFQPAGMQLAPDGTIWIGQIYYLQYNAVPRQSFASIIRRPNVAGAGCGLELTGYYYPPGRVFWWMSAFPNVITNMLFAPPVLNHETGCAGDSVQFWASSAGPSAGLRWDFGDPGSGPANTATGRQAAHRYPQGGTYAVRLTLANGQVLTQTVQAPSNEADFSDANIFTPNADGLNDTFRPVLRGEVVGGARLQVFSRWGQRLYETTAPAPQWDGAGAVSGEYFYQLDYADCQGNPRHRRGILTLRR